MNVQLLQILILKLKTTRVLISEIKKNTIQKREYEKQIIRPNYGTHDNSFFQANNGTAS
jgi:hypothetical protein